MGQEDWLEKIADKLTWTNSYLIVFLMFIQGILFFNAANVVEVLESNIRI